MLLELTQDGTNAMHLLMTISGWFLIGNIWIPEHFTDCLPAVIPRHRDSKLWATNLVLAALLTDFRLGFM